MITIKGSNPLKQVNCEIPGKNFKLVVRAYYPGKQQSEEAYLIDDSIIAILM